MGDMYSDVMNNTMHAMKVSLPLPWQAMITVQRNGIVTTGPVSQFIAKPR